VHYFFQLQNQAQSKKKSNKNKSEIYGKQNIYQFKVEDLSGNVFDFSSLKGKKVMIVNTVKMWTPQYKDLEAIYKEYKDKAFDCRFSCKQFCIARTGNK
jgi:glutathione peroxidase